AAQVGIGAIPVDIEERREAAGAAVPENIGPPRVVTPVHRHVARHDNDNQAQTRSAERSDKTPKSWFPAQLNADGCRIDDVVSVHRTWTRREDRRSIEMAHPEGGEIRNHAGCIGEGEAPMEL